MTVLSLLVLMVGVMVSSASLTVTSSKKHLTADDQARLVFDRMQMDFARMLKRGDVYFQFLKQPGNDQFTFYSETPGFFDGTTTSANQSNLSLVSYQFNSSYQMERLGQGCQWTDITFSPTSTPTINSTDFHLLSTSVFRMEIAFLIRESATSFLITSTAPTPGSQAYQNFYAVIVAIAVLDPNSQQLVSLGSYPTLISALARFTGSETIVLNSTSPPVSATIDPILSVWHTAVNAPNFAQVAGISPVAAQQVRIYQRIIYLQ